MTDDATVEFEAIGHSAGARQMLADFLLGSVVDSDAESNYEQSPLYVPAATACPLGKGDRCGQRGASWTAIATASAVVLAFGAYYYHLHK